MKKVFRKAGYTCYFVLLLALLLGYSVYTEEISEEKELRLQSENNTGITVEEILPILPEEASFYTEKDAWINNSYRRVKKVMIYPTDENETALPVRLLSGTFIRKGTEEAEYVAVISRELSLELFLTVHSIGQKFLLDGTGYTVVGVYEDPLPDVVKDGYERIYVPYNSALNWEENRVDAIAVSEELETLQLDMGRFFDEYEVVDYAVLKQTAVQWGRIFNFLLGILVLALLYQKVNRAEKEYLLIFKRAYKQMYLQECIGKYKKYMASAVFFICILAGYLFIIWEMVRFEIVIPSDILPDENIFDFPWYWKVLSEQIQLYHRGGLCGNSEMELLAVLAGGMGILISIIGICYTRFVFRGNQRIRLKRKGFGVLIFVILLCLAMVLPLRDRVCIITIILLVIVTLFHRIEIKAEF